MKWKAILGLFVVALGVLALLPKIVSGYVISVLLVLFLYLSLAASWNIISGFTGYPSFGHVAFFGIGAYVASLLIVGHGLSWPLASIAGGAAAALGAAAIGSICLRLKSVFFAIAMLGLSETLRVVATHWESLTKGGFGISLPPTRDIAPFYYATALLGAVAIGMNLLVARSDFGLRLLAIREDEGAAESVGVDTTTCKIMAFVLSAILPGIAGGVYAQYISYIDPPTVFSVFITIQMVVMTVFGGRGTVLGPVIGAVVLSVVAELFWAEFPFLHRTLYGALIMLTVLFIPDGLVEELKGRGLLPRTRTL